MLPKQILFLSLLLWAANAQANESCTSMEKKDGKIEWVKVPCSTFDRPIPCSKYTPDGKGRVLIEDRPCLPGEQKTVQQVEREEAAAQKKLCGKDYQALRVGMKVDRFEECTEALRFISETTSKGGIVETYRSTFYFIDAKDGRIVSFTRRTR